MGDSAQTFNHEHSMEQTVVSEELRLVHSS